MKHLSEETDVKGKEGERRNGYPHGRNEKMHWDDRNARYDVFNLMDDLLPTSTEYWFCTAEVLDYICKTKLRERGYAIGEHLLFRASGCERREAYAIGGGKGGETGLGGDAENTETDGLWKAI